MPIETVNKSGWLVLTLLPLSNVESISTVVPILCVCVCRVCVCVWGGGG